MRGASAIASIVKKPASSNGDYLLIEQRPYAAGVGRVSRLDLVQALAKYHGADDEPEVDCGINEATLDTGVFVYPSRPGMFYQVGVTHGTLSDPLLSEVIVRESLSFSLDTEKSLKYPVHSIVGYEWASKEVWNGDGASVGKPAISVDGTTVSVDFPVYGTVYVTYKTMRIAYRLTILAREKSPGTTYNSVAWVRWNGGVLLEKIEPPKNAEDNFEAGVKCTGGSNVTIEPPPDDPGLPTVDGKNITEKIDYCTGKLKT